MSQPKATILVCCHKEGVFLSDETYLPVHCGKANAAQDLGIQGDDTGIHISPKNPNFCELTALYWMWKNPTDADYVGLCHYRRYFCKAKRLFSSRVYTYATLDQARKQLIDKFDVIDYLSGKEILLANRNYCPYNLRTEYACMLNSLEYKVLKEVVAELYPDSVPAFEQVMYYGNAYSAFNMFVCRRELFDAYAQWLFDILFEVERRLCIGHYTGHFARVFGYMAERLLNVYACQHRLRIKHLPVAMITTDYRTGLLKEWCKRVRAELSFVLNKPHRRPECFFE